MNPLNIVQNRQLSNAAMHNQGRSKLVKYREKIFVNCIFKTTRTQAFKGR